ncbi:uncharacterized protein LOC142776840 [Rhipicephalus microplus]|uniref:uncharacterized protein LOC142776840 n=1 Tax=Rhipicephalus microplus TaxID=6941 RepID=UPI003F6C5422
MAAPLSSFREALSARPVRDILSLHPWDPLPGPRLPFDNNAGWWLRPSRTTFAGLSPASDPERQRQCPASAALPVQPPLPMRMLRPGPHTLNFSARDSTHKKHRDIIAAFSGLGGTVARTPTHSTPLLFVQYKVGLRVVRWTHAVPLPKNSQASAKFPSFWSVDRLLRELHMCYTGYITSPTQYLGT